MKKIYLLMMGLVALVASTLAQSTNCTSAGFTPVAAWFSNNIAIPPYCKVVVQGGPTGSGPGGNPSGFISIRKVGGGLIPIKDSNPLEFFVAIGADGKAEFNYDCSFTPDRLLIDYFDVNGDLQQCDAPIANGGALPIKLTSFTGRLKTDNSVTLDWTSAIELTSFQYEIQRSVDGKNYEKVGILQAAGTSLDAIKYTFEDHLPATGAYFYRLKQIDVDGFTEYSKVVYVNSKKGSGVVTKIFPNPFKGEVQLIGATSADLTPNNIHVYSIAGQLIQYRFMGANSILIDPSAPDGVYIVQVKDQRFKLVKSPSGTGY